MATAAFENQVLDLSFLANASLAAKQFYAVYQTNAGKIDVPSAQGQRCMGILQDDPASGGAGSVRVLGVSKAILGGTVSYDDPLCCDSSGKLIAQTSDAEQIIARALSSGVSGDIIPVLMPAGMAAGAEGANGYMICIPIVLATVANGDVVTTFTPGFAGKITKTQFLVTTAVTTGSKAATLNLEIGTTNLTGGEIALTSANCTPLGAVVAGAAVTAANTFTATDTISVEASSVTTFAEGAGLLMITYR